MAWTLQLLDDSTTLNLNDNSSYSAQTLNAPIPRRRLSTGGGNLFRDGSDIVGRVYANRVVTVTLRIYGTSQDNLIANINAIDSLLERGAEYQTSGLGSQLKLRRKWENATNQVDFYVLEGTLELGNEFSDIHKVNTTFTQARLTLLCDPFAYGADETIKNYVLDAGFEVFGTALADWTESKTATGTTARDTSVKKNGDASLKLTMTDSGGSGQVIERSQVLADVDAGEVWSFQCWVRVDALSNCKVVMELDYNTGTDVEVSTTTVNASEFVKLTANNNTVPGSVTQVTLRLRLEATAADATGTVYIDNVIAVQAAAVPTAWASSYVVGNHFEDAQQSQQFLMDIEDIPGDMPALLQVRVHEQQSHDEFWLGARHGSRQYDSRAGGSAGALYLEGEAGSATTTGSQTNYSFASTTASGTKYSGNSRSQHRVLHAVSPSSSTLTADTFFRQDFGLTVLPEGLYRCLVAVEVANGAGNSSTQTPNANIFIWGVNYTYGGISLLDTTNPDTTSFVAMSSNTLAQDETSNPEILDLGSVVIPPVATPEGQTAGTFTLSIHMGTNANTTINAGQEIYWFIDWVMLMPVDQGSIYVSKTDAADVLLADSISRVKGVYILNTNDVLQSFPTNQLGRAPMAHPDGTRLYMVGQDGDYTGDSESYHVQITYRPRFLHVAGA
jgi:hypothetical protein